MDELRSILDSLRELAQSPERDRYWGRFVPPPWSKQLKEELPGQWSAAWAKRYREEWERLNERLWPMMVAAAFRHLGDHQHLAEDVAQATTIKLYVRPEVFLRSADGFLAYVYKAVRNECFSVLRKRQAHGSALRAYARRDGETFDQDAAALLLVEEAGIPIEPEELALLDLVRREMTMQQMAAATGESVGTIGSRLHRLRKALQKRLRQSE